MNTLRRVVEKRIYKRKGVRLLRKNKKKRVGVGEV